MSPMMACGECNANYNVLNAIHARYCDDQRAGKYGSKSVGQPKYYVKPSNTAYGHVSG